MTTRLTTQVRIFRHWRERADVLHSNSAASRPAQLDHRLQLVQRTGSPRPSPLIGGREVVQEKLSAGCGWGLRLWLCVCGDLSLTLTHSHLLAHLLSPSQSPTLTPLVSSHSNTRSHSPTLSFSLTQTHSQSKIEESKQLPLSLTHTRNSWIRSRRCKPTK